MDAVGSRHPRRRARPRGAAHPAAQQRCRERGVDLRQDALRRRRPADPAARPALRAQERPAGAGELGRGAARWSARKLKAAEARAHRRHRRRPGGRRGDVRARGPARAARRRATSIAGRTAPSSTRASAAPATCSTPPSRASSRPMRSCWSAPIRGSRRRCSTRASASAGARAALAVGLIGERADLTYPYEYLGAGPQTLEGRGRRQAQLRRGAARRQAPDGDRRRRRRGARRRRGGAGRRGQDRARRRPGQGRRLERLQRAAHARPRASPASTSASCRARAASMSRGMLAAAGKGQLDVLYLLGADEIDMSRARQGLRGLPGQPRRRRRPARRRHPAGRRLHREERHLRQHRGPRADDGQRRVPAGRGQGGLGDPARAVRRMSATSCPTTPFRPCARPCTRRRRRWRASTRSSRPACDGVEALAARGGALGAEPFGPAVRDFYLTNPIARASAVMAELSALEEEPASRGRPERMASTWSWPEIWQAYLLAAAGDGVPERGAAGGAAGHHRLPAADGPQGVGGGAAAPRPQRGGAVRAAAVVRRSAEVRAQGAADPGRRRQGRVPAGAAGGLRAGAGRLGGDPASTRTAGAAG